MEVKSLALLELNLFRYLCYSSIK